MKFQKGDKIGWKPLVRYGPYDSGFVHGYNRKGQLVVSWETGEKGCRSYSVEERHVKDLILIEPANYREFKEKIIDRLR